MPAKVKGESKSSTVGMLAAVPMPEPRSTMRRRMRAQQRPVDCLTAAREAVAEADRKRAKEHDLAINVPRRNTLRPQLERLFIDGVIDEQQHRAAEHLMRDFETSGFKPGVVASYEGVGIGGAGMIGTGPTAKEYMQAMVAIGPALQPVVIAVLFFDVSPSQWAEANGRGNRKDGVPLLRAGLDNLAYYYGLKRSPFAPKKPL